MKQDVQKGWKLLLMDVAVRSLQLSSSWSREIEMDRRRVQAGTRQRYLLPLGFQNTGRSWHHYSLVANTYSGSL